MPDKPSVAVLEFVNMSSDDEQEYFMMASPSVGRHGIWRPGHRNPHEFTVAEDTTLDPRVPPVHSMIK